MEKKRVIYTALAGGYDNIIQPLVVNPLYDYILFSNDIHESEIGVWKVRKIPYHNNDNTRVNRWAKLHPEVLLRDYCYVVYIDANVQIVTNEFYDVIENKIKARAIISVMWHAERDCIYDEISAVMLQGLDNEDVVFKWLKKLVKEKYPEHNGLFENNIIFRNIYDDRISRLDELWWKCIEQYSRRDQLSFTYCLWRMNVDCPYFLGEGLNTRNSECVKLYGHSNSLNRTISHNQSKYIVYYKQYNYITTYSVIKFKSFLLKIATKKYPKFYSNLFGYYYLYKCKFRQFKIFIYNLLH